MEFPLSLSLPKAGLPLIITSGKLKNLCFLIDTEATNNSIYIERYLAEDFRYTFYGEREIFGNQVLNK